jgi:urease accessory protein
MTTGADRDTWRLKLMTWLSPAFPVGSFAFSSGLEFAASTGELNQVKALRAWLEDSLLHGAARTDAVLLAAAWRGPADLADLNALALALAPSAERRLETAAQGTAFLAAIRAAWPAPGILLLHQTIGEDDLAYPVALGVAARAHDIPLRETLEGFALAGAANFVSAALRLSLIGQSEAQASLAALLPRIDELAAWAVDTSLDELGTSTWRADIASMRHETLYSRLFRS